MSQGQIEEAKEEAERLLKGTTHSYVQGAKLVASVLLEVLREAEEAKKAADQ